MSRAGYDTDCDGWELIKYRGQVNSALRGMRGLEFLRELVVALEALPEKKLCNGDLQREDGACCALGAVGKLRGIDMTEMDGESMTEDGKLGEMFNIANQLVREIEYENDDKEWGFVWFGDTSLPKKNGQYVDKHGLTKEEWMDKEDEVRWGRIYIWAQAQIKRTEAFREKRGWSIN